MTQPFEGRVVPAWPEFRRLAKPGRAIPVRLQVSLDTETAVSAFLKVSLGQTQSFLLESVEGERVGRYSMLGAGPLDVHRFEVGVGEDPFSVAERKIKRWEGVRLPGAPPFTGGLVGYLSWDSVKRLEPRVPIANVDPYGMPEAVWMDFDTLVAFDNLKHGVEVVAQVRCEKGYSARSLYDDALKRIAEMLRRLEAPLRDPRPPSTKAPTLKPTVSRAKFIAAVKRAKEYVSAGDCQQIVLSQRFDAELKVSPFELYRALRRVNPSPYLIYLQDGDQAVVGSSPESVVDVRGRGITLKPIAGTRKRGATPQIDQELAEELKGDPKENAEHTMLVDLGRNDVGRVARIGSVKVSRLKVIERYSHVMHLVSRVEGELAAGKSSMDVVRSVFPAGTVSGAPKVRAMEIIDELEPARRGPYAGALGYLDATGDLELALLIRTLYVRGSKVSAQAGAGIVYDSDPDAEYEETVNKAKALFRAVQLAHEGEKPGRSPR